MNVLEIIEKEVYAEEYNPDRPNNKYTVRLSGKGAKDIDMKPAGETMDILGHGETFEQAAEEALTKAGLFKRPPHPEVRPLEIHFPGAPDSFFHRRKP